MTLTKATARRHRRLCERVSKFQISLAILRLAVASQQRADAHIAAPDNLQQFFRRCGPLPYASPIVINCLTNNIRHELSGTPPLRRSRRHERVTSRQVGARSNGRNPCPAAALELLRGGGANGLMGHCIGLPAGQRIPVKLPLHRPRRTRHAKFDGSRLRCANRV
jgi:hypothetical protein